MNDKSLDVLCRWTTVVLVGAALAGCGRRGGAGDGSGRAGIEERARDGARVEWIVGGGGPGLVDVAVGADGFGVATGPRVVLVTADAGATWRVVEGCGKEEFAGAHVGGAGEAWAVAMGALLHTGDAGATWTRAERWPSNFYHFGPSSACGARYFQMQPPTCSATVCEAIDGGRSWRPLPASLPRNDYECVFFLDARHGWVAGEHGRLAHTADGGAAWTVADVAGEPHIVQIQFISERTGFARTTGFEGDNILWTNDGGATWKPAGQIAARGALRDMHFLDGAVGYVAARVGEEASQVWRTSDGGATWQVLGEHPGARLNALWFGATGGGCVVGEAGYLCRYLPAVGS